MNKKLLQSLSKIMAFLIIFTSIPVNVFANEMRMIETPEGFKINETNRSSTQQIGIAKGRVSLEEVFGGDLDTSEDLGKFIVTPDGKPMDITNQDIEITFEVDDRSEVTGVSGIKEVYFGVQDIGAKQVGDFIQENKQPIKEGSEVGEFQVTITQNGKYFVGAIDVAGNKTFKPVTVDLIDKEAPEVDGFERKPVKGDDPEFKELTNKGTHLVAKVTEKGSPDSSGQEDKIKSGLGEVELVKINGKEEEIVEKKTADGDGSFDFHIKDNGKYVVIVKDKSGNVYRLDDDKSITVNNLVNDEDVKDVDDLDDNEKDTDNPTNIDPEGNEWSIRPLKPTYKIIDPKDKKDDKDDVANKWRPKKIVQFEAPVEKDNPYNKPKEIHYRIKGEGTGKDSWKLYNPEVGVVLTQNAVVEAVSVSDVGVQSLITTVDVKMIANPETDGWVNEKPTLTVEDGFLVIKPNETKPMNHTGFTGDYIKVERDGDKSIEVGDIIKFDDKKNKEMTEDLKTTLNDLGQKHKGEEIRIEVVKHNETQDNTVSSKITVRFDKDGNPTEIDDDIYLLDDLEKEIIIAEKETADKDGKPTEKGKEYPEKDIDYIKDREDHLDKIKDMIKEIEKKKEDPNSKLNNKDHEEKLEELKDRAKELEDKLEEQKRSFVIKVSHSSKDKTMSNKDKYGVELGEEILHEGDIKGHYPVEDIFIGSNYYIQSKEIHHFKPVKDILKTDDGKTYIEEVYIGYVGQVIDVDIEYERKYVDVNIYAEVGEDENKERLLLETRPLLSGQPTEINAYETENYDKISKDYVLEDINIKDKYVSEYTPEGDYNEKWTHEQTSDNTVVFKFRKKTFVVEPEEGTGQPDKDKEPIIPGEPGGNSDNGDKDGNDGSGGGSNRPVIREGYYKIRHVDDRGRDMIIPEIYKARLGTKVVATPINFKNYKYIPGNRIIIVGERDEIVLRYDYLGDSEDNDNNGQELPGGEPGGGNEGDKPGTDKPGTDGNGNDKPGGDGGQGNTGGNDKPGDQSGGNTGGNGSSNDKDKPNIDDNGNIEDTRPKPEIVDGDERVESKFTVRHLDAIGRPLRNEYSEIVVVGFTLTVPAEDIKGYKVVDGFETITKKIDENPVNNIFQFVYDKIEDLNDFEKEWDNNTEVEDIPDIKDRDPLKRANYTLHARIDGKIDKDYTRTKRAYIGSRIIVKAPYFEGLGYDDPGNEVKVLVISPNDKNNVLIFDYYRLDNDKGDRNSSGKDANIGEGDGSDLGDDNWGGLFPDGNIPQLKPQPDGGLGNNGDDNGVGLDGTVNDKDKLNPDKDKDSSNRPDDTDWDDLLGGPHLSGQDLQDELDKIEQNGQNDDIIFIDKDGVYRPGASLEKDKNGNWYVADENGNIITGGGIVITPDGNTIVIGEDGYVRWDGDDSGVIHLSGGKKDKDKGSKLDGFFGTTGKGGKLSSGLKDSDYSIKLPAKKENKYNKFKDTIGDFSKMNPMLNKVDHIPFIEGDNEGYMRPNNNITREETVTIIYRILDPEFRKDKQTKEHPFKDVENGRWSEEFVATLANIGIIKGKSEIEFAPRDNITRAEAAAMLTRFYSADVDTSNVQIPDIKGHWAEENIKKAFALGWINGYEDGTFKPNNDITRAELVVVVNKMLDRQPKLENMKDGYMSFPDVKETDWFYRDIKEAYEHHDYMILKGEEIWVTVYP